MKKIYIKFIMIISFTMSLLLISNMAKAGSLLEDVYTGFGISPYAKQKDITLGYRQHGYENKHLSWFELVRYG